LVPEGGLEPPTPRL